MSIRTAPELKATAYHEAGHAVAHWSFGVRFKYVTIVPTPDFLGHVRRIHPKWFQPDSVDARTEQRIRHDIIAGYAGQLAEATYRRKRPRYGMHRDNAEAVHMAFRLCGSKKTTEAYLRYCWCASEDLVSVHWRAIKAVAAALLEKETLQYIDVTEAIMRAVRDWAAG